MAEICVFGASTTWGTWDSEKGGWVNRLRLFVDEHKRRHFVYNLGIPGDTTADLLKRFDIEARTRDPELIIFSVGANDALINHATGTHEVEAEQFEKNLHELVLLALKYTNQIVFVGLRQVDESKTKPVAWDGNVHCTNGDIEKYDNILKKVAATSGCFYIGMSGVLDASSDLENGFDPNAKGHEKIFRRVKEYLTTNNIL